MSSQLKKDHATEISQDGALKKRVKLAPSSDTVAAKPMETISHPSQRALSSVCSQVAERVRFGPF